MVQHVVEELPHSIVQIANTTGQLQYGSTNTPQAGG
jgi:hypothetical protein